MRKAYMQYNRRTGNYELYVVGKGVRYRSNTVNGVLDYAERNGYDLVEYD